MAVKSQFHQNSAKNFVRNLRHAYVTAIAASYILVEVTSTKRRKQMRVFNQNSWIMSFS